jgi:tetratricopeptide (TPR) repeat protein
MSALDELLNRWRKSPEAGATIALCSHLGASQRKDLIVEVGSAAQKRYANHADVMLVVGRMYLSVAMFAEAQVALVQAGKANPQNGLPFRFLGEVLLRRGDAERALKVFERAAQLGVTEPELARWQGRAQVYSALQRRVGADAVAKEVAKNEPLRPSMAPAAPPVDLHDLSVLDDLDRPLLPTSRVSSAAPPPPRAQPSVGRAVLPPSAKFSSGRESRPIFGNTAPAYARRVELPSEREQLLSSDLEAEESEPAFRPKVVHHSSEDITRPRIDSAVPARTQQSGSLPRFDESIEPPTVPGNAAYPKSIPGHAAFRRNLQSRGDFDAGAVPSPALVLEHLARVGLFEPEGAVKPAWEQAPKQKTRGAWVFVLATVLVGAGGGGGYYYAEQVKTERMAQAARLNTEVSSLLLTGNLDKIRATDEKLKQAFELDSLSKDAARRWLENRFLLAILAPDEPRGLDSATHRAKRVGMDDAEFAFGKLAAFLTEGDVAGAAALLPKWDKKAGKDAYYQLAAGAVLERAGDLRAIERYEAARALDPKLLVADMLLARVALLELGPEKARPVIDSLRQKGGDAATLQALEALYWAVDSGRPEQVPAAARIDKVQEGSLVVPLRPIVYAVEALQAIESGDYKEASRAIDQGVERSLTPAMATQLGFLAIQAGDENLARSAALRALSFSAVYPKARVLAARVALLGGRLEEAQKAIEQLDPNSNDVAIVRAVVAYETLDPSALDVALEAFGDTKDRHELEALAASRGVLLGSSYPAEDAVNRMAQPQIPWGQAIAVDIALATGQLDLAESLTSQWPTDVVRPIYSLRVSRLLRYQGKAKLALEHSKRALSTPTMPAVLERALVLLESEDTAGARDVIAQYPALLGATAGWLSILVDAASGREKQAAASAAAKDFPPDATPLALRLLAARAFAVAKDKRAKDYVKLMQRVAKGHPEAAALGELL